MQFDSPPNELAVVVARLMEEPTAGLDPLAEVGLPDRKLAWKEASGRLGADQVVSRAACGRQAHPGEHFVSGGAPDQRQIRGRAVFEPSTPGSFFAQQELAFRHSHAAGFAHEVLAVDFPDFRHRCM